MKKGVVIKTAMWKQRSVTTLDELGIENETENKNSKIKN